MSTLTINLTIGPYIQGTVPVGSLLRVLTVDGDGKVLTAEASHLREDATSTYLEIDSPSAYLSLAVQDTLTGDVAGFQAQPTYSIMYQQGATFALDGQEAYLKTTSVPIGTSGIVGIDATGKLVTTPAGIYLSSTLDGLSIMGSAITSSDTLIGAFGALQNQINGILGGAVYQGTWNATTNTPTLSDGTGTKGHYYVVSVAGTQNLGSGAITFDVGDWAIHNGTVYQKVDNTDAVSSVNSAIGSVVITTTGTADRITVTGGSGLTPTVDIASTYAGQSSIVTIGTLANGTVPAARISAGTFGTGAYVMGTSLSTPSLIGTSGQLAFTSVAQSSGAIIDYLFTPSAHTAQTASTNTPVFRVASATKTLATGALTAWYANHLQTQTLAFAGASTVTDAFGLYVEAVTQGTLATLTNSYSLGTNGFVKFGSGLSGVIFRNDVSTNNYCGFYNANSTPSPTNYFLKSNGTTTLLNATTGGILYLAFGGTSVLNISSTTAMTIAEGVTTNAGTTTGWKIGGATTQKIALWNKTPIVQPTTSISVTASFVANTSANFIYRESTIGGYTFEQIAQALINLGALA